MKPTRLILIPGPGTEPAPYLVIVDGVVRERGLLELHLVEPPEPMRTVAIIPGTEVTIRWLDLPVGGPAQQRAAASWMLKEHLAVPADRLATALGPIPGAGEARLVALVAMPLLQAWIDYLEALDVKPDVIVPDVLTVSEPNEDNSLNAVVFGSATALRGRGFAASIQPDLVALVAGPRRVEAITDAAAVERALVEAALKPPINLLTSLDPARSTARRSWTMASVMAGLLAISPLALIAAAAARDDASARANTVVARAEVVRVAPDLARRPNPVEALRQRVRAAPPPGGVVGATAALFAAVEGVEAAELDLLIVDPVAGMKASVTHADYQDTQAIARAMRSSGLEVTETAAINDRGRIVSDITIGRAR
jgi:general secretion pathway protein L